MNKFFCKNPFWKHVYFTNKTVFKIVISNEAFLKSFISIDVSFKFDSEYFKVLNLLLLSG